MKGSDPSEKIAEIRQKIVQLQKSTSLEALDDLQACLEGLQEEEELRQKAGERAAAQQAVEVKRQHYQDLFDFAPEGYIVTDLEGTIQEANCAAAILFSTDQGFLKGKPLIAFVAEKDRLAFHLKLASLGQEDRARGWEVSIQPSEGLPIPTIVSTGAVHDDDGKLIGLRWQLHDITDRKRTEEALIKTRANELDAIFSSMAEPLIIYDNNRVVTKANPAAIIAFGFDPVGLDQQELFQRLSARQSDGRPADADSTVSTRALQGEAIKGEWYLFRNADGEEKIAASSAAPIRNGGDKIIGAVAIWHDITEQERLLEQLKRAWDDQEIRIRERTNELVKANEALQSEIAQRKMAEEGLCEARNYLENLIDYANAPIIVWDPSFRIMRFNHAFEHLTGRNADDVLGKPLNVLFPEESRDESLAHISRTQSGERWEAVEIPILHEDGAVHTVLWNSATLYDNNGTTVIATIAQGQDITERKQAEERLRLANRQLQDIIDFLPDATFVIDGDRKVIAWNRAMEEMTGVRKDGIMGKGDYACSVPFYGKPRPMLIDLVDKHDEEIESKYLHIERKGDTLYAEAYVPSLFSDKGAYVWAIASPLYDNDGNLSGSIESLRDITDRKRAVEELEKRDTLLAGLAAAANALLTAQDYAAGMNHALEILGLSADVDRVYIFENHDSEEGEHFVSQRFEWAKETVKAQIDNPDLQNVSYERMLPRWYSTLGSGEPISGLVRNFPESERAIIEPKNTVSLLAVPIMVEGKFWGFIGFDECYAERSWTESEVSLLRAAAGSIGATIVRKQAEEAYRVLVDQSLQGLIIFQEERVVFANEAYARMVGYTVEEKLAMSPEEVQATTHPEDRAIVWGRHRDRLEGKHAPEHYEFRAIRKDGSLIWLDMHASLIMYHGKLAVQAAVLDITERKRAEEALKESERRLADIINFLPDATFVIDRDGKVIAWNRAMEATTGVKAGDILGKGNYEYTIPFYGERRPVLIDLMLKPQEEIEKIYANLERRDGTLVGEAHLPNLKGSEAYLLGTAAALYNSKGDIVGAIESLRDITARKRAEEQLARKTADLVRSNAELQQFAYVASHDLQEPLRMVASYVQLLQRRYKGKLDSDADEFIGYAVDGANRMQQLINDLLTYSRVGTRGKPFEPTDCEVIFDRMIANLKVAIEESGAVVTHDPLPTVMADSSQLVQLMQNLIGNAIKFRSEEQPRVHVSAKQDSADWVFSICDNGIGIDPQFKERIFLIFQRLHSRSEYPGTVIGLAVCKKIVERHNGRIWVESEPGKGSTFYFTISQDSECPSAVARA